METIGSIGLCGIFRDISKAYEDIYIYKGYVGVYWDM